MAQKFRTSDATGRWVLVTTILASSMAFISSSALNVALDALQTDLEATGAELIWIVNAYLLFLASFILIGGSLGDHYGRKKVFGAGIAIFTVASAACGLAPDTTFLTVMRAVQGFGGALMVPGSLAIISALFEDDERGRAIGIWSAVSTITTVGGPVLGGFFADFLSWRYVFFINIPFALLALYALTQIPENRDENATPRMDYLGAMLIVLGLGGLTFGLVTLGDRQSIELMGTGPAILGLIVGVVSLVAFVIVESRVKYPMVDLALFKSRTFSGANAMCVFLYAALSGSLLFLPLNLVQIQGYSATVAGFANIPFTILVTILSPWAGTLVDRFGSRLPLTIGPLIVAAGFATFALPGVTGGPTDYWLTFFPPMVLVGVGMGVTIAPLTASVMGAVSSDQSGIASGINNAVTRSSQVLATAVLGGVALAVFSGALMTRAADLPLTNDQMMTLEVNAAELGNTVPPEGLDGETTASVETAIDLSFVDMFRVVNVIGAVLCVIAAIMAAVILEPHHKPAQLEWHETLDCSRQSTTATRIELPQTAQQAE